jgi:hypothetical protein
MSSSNKIALNDILKLDDLDNVKVRFNMMFKGNWNPVHFFKNADHKTLLEGHYWNYKRQKSYKVGQVTIGFLKLNDENLWLLFHIGRVTKDLNKLNGVGYEYQELPQFRKYFGRLIIRFKNKSQNMVRLASSVIEDCEVVQILPDAYDNDIFPGYDQVKLTWEELKRVITKESWKTALQNQKGVYLITDSSNGKMYIGSAYGEQMILGRWMSYVETGHGGNVELKSVGFENIKHNFEYSILEIFKSTTDDHVILERESWWKSVLRTREFGYNRN